MYTKKCENENCEALLEYKRANALSRAIKDKTYCKECCAKNREKEVLEVYISICRECGSEKKHKTRQSFNYAKSKDSLCRKCGSKNKKAEKQDTKVICPNCKEERNLSSAKLARRALLNNNGLCLSCSLIGKHTKTEEEKSKTKEKYKEKTKEIRKKYYKEYRILNHKEKKDYTQTISGRFSSYRSGAKSRNIEFNLTEEQFKIFWQKDCIYCFSKINTIGIDRVDNKKGYSLENCVSCCSYCNRMKLDFSKEEFLQHIEKIYKINFK